MQRMGMVLRLRPDQVTAYCQLHAAVWPQVLARLSASHITNYSIFLRQPENLLFSYFEYTGTDYARRCRGHRRRSGDAGLVGDLRTDARPAAQPRPRRMVGRHGRGVSP